MNKFLKTIACFLVFVLAFVGGFAGYFVLTKPDNDQSNIVTNALEIHVMQLGNGKSGDSIYIKAGDTDILVDGGSEIGSLETVKNYLNERVADGILEYVIVTHADLDHIAIFAGTTGENTSIFDFFKCETIIDFPLTNKTTQAYDRYVQKRDREVSEDGATHYTALECYNNENGAQRSYNLGFGTTLDFLYHDFYETRHDDENNYSVCFMIKQSGRNFLFTGDLEEDGEESLVTKNTLGEVEFFKAGHHGSKTSSNDVLLDIIKPQICVVSCSAGSVQYLTSGTQNLANTFPTQAFIDRISKHTDKVYVPTSANVYMDSESGRWKDGNGYNLLNGHIVVISKPSGVTVECSNNNTILKDTQWFGDNRQMPTAWQK